MLSLEGTVGTKQHLTFYPCLKDAFILTNFYEIIVNKVEFIIKSFQ